jgi:hypothetical protein
MQRALLKPPCSDWLRTDHIKPRWIQAWPQQEQRAPMSFIQIKVPDIGDFADVTVIQLMVRAGDSIKVEQSPITVESDNASMENGGHYQ